LQEIIEPIEMLLAKKYSLIEKKRKKKTKIF